MPPSPASPVQVESLADELPQDVGTEVLGERIDGDDAGADGILAINALDLGIADLPAIAKPLGFAREGKALAMAKSTGHEALVEPDTFEDVSAVVGQDHAEDESSSRDFASFHLDDLALDHLGAIGLEIGDGPHLGQVLVAARKMPEQVAHGGKVELGQ